MKKHTMKPITNKFIGFNVLVSKSNGVGIEGELLEVDNFGLSLLAEIDSEHEVKEKVIVYIPHRSVDVISARENDNFDSKELLSYEELFGGAV